MTRRRIKGHNSMLDRRVLRGGFVFGVVVVLLLCTLPPRQADAQDGGFLLRTVILDPGHGGKDPGATNRWGLREKDITLQVARQIRDYLKANSPFEVVLTRDSDRTLSLEERTAIANRYDPLRSVFVSIHCNAATNTEARGAETYIYNNEASDARARRVAKRENMGTSFSLNFIFADLRHRAMVPFTDALASHIQTELVQNDGIEDRRVRRGPFYVLFYTTMPSVLVELGFITNREEQAALRSEKHQAKLARAIGEAILAFSDQTAAWNLANASAEE